MLPAYTGNYKNHGRHGQKLQPMLEAVLIILIVLLVLYTKPKAEQPEHVAFRRDCPICGNVQLAGSEEALEWICPNCGWLLWSL